MTGKNANVIYEVGYAHALEKPVVLLTESADDISFDLKNQNHIIYGGSIMRLKNGLVKIVKELLEIESDIAINTHGDGAQT